MTVKQLFNNRSHQPIEAVYVFPLPEEASVTGASLQIGQKTVVAELKEKKQARQEYEDAVSAGHHGGLLEQKRPNVFTINVGGIEPGEDIQAVVTYNQPIPWQDGGWQVYHSHGSRAQVHSGHPDRQERRRLVA